MIVIYLNDQTKNFPTKIEEIIFLGPLFLKDVTFGNDDIIPKKEMGKEIAKINLGNITKIDDSSFPTFNGDLVNKKGQNNFNLLNIGKPMTVYKPTMDTKGRVVGGYQTLELTDNDLEGVSHSKLVFDNTETYRTGYAHTKFTKGLNTNNYLTTNKTNNITKAIEIIPSDLDNDFVLNDASLTTIEEELTPGFLYGVMKRDYDKYGINNKPMEKFNNIGAKPWINQRNFATKDPTTTELSIEPTIFYDYGIEQPLNVSCLNNVVMVSSYDVTDKGTLYHRFFKVKNGVMESTPYYTRTWDDHTEKRIFSEDGMYVINNGIEWSSTMSIGTSRDSAHKRITFDKNLMPIYTERKKYEGTFGSWIDNKCYGYGTSDSGYFSTSNKDGEIVGKRSVVPNALNAQISAGTQIELYSIGSKVYNISGLNHGYISVNEHFNGVIYKDWILTDFTIGKKIDSYRILTLKSTFLVISYSSPSHLSFNLFKYDNNGNITEQIFSKSYTGKNYADMFTSRMYVVSTGKNLYIFLKNKIITMKLDVGFVDKDYVEESKLTYKNMINLQ